MRVHRTPTNFERSPAYNRPPIVVNKKRIEQQAMPGGLRVYDDCADTHIQTRMLIAMRRQWWAIIDRELKRASAYAGG